MHTYLFFSFLFSNHHYVCSVLFVDPSVLLQFGQSLIYILPFRQQACDHGYFQRDPCCCLVYCTARENMVDANSQTLNKIQFNHKRDANGSGF